MSKQALVITPTNVYGLYDLSVNGNELANLQQLVGGWVQMVGLTEDIDLWCNEEGKMTGLPLNVPATIAWEVAHGPTDVMVGTVVLTGSHGDQIDSIDLQKLYSFLSTTEDGGLLGDVIRGSIEILQPTED